MAANTLPSGIDDLFLLGDRIEKGLRTHGPWLLQGWMPADEFSGFLSTARATEAAFTRARSLKAMAGKRFAEADAELTAWLAKARLVVMLAYGSQWSESWLATGFTHRGTNVPKRIGPRIELARRLAHFLAEFPQYEVPFARVTAVGARAMHEEITTCEKEVRRATSEATEKKRARDVAEKELRRQMGKVRVLLPTALKKNDPRWRVFGLNTPRPHEKTRPRTYPTSATQPLQVDFAPAAESLAAQTAIVA